MQSNIAYVPLNWCNEFCVFNSSNFLEVENLSYCSYCFNITRLFLLSTF